MLLFKKKSCIGVMNVGDPLRGFMAFTLIRKFMLGERLYVCSECRKSCTSSHNLFYHWRVQRTEAL